MVAENEEALLRNHDFSIRAGVGVIVGDVIFVKRFFVDVDLAVFNADVVSGDADDALDVALRGIAGIAEDNDVAALNGLPAIDEFIDEYAFLVFEAGHHAQAFNLHWLVEKNNNEGGDGERYQQVAH